MRTRIAMVVIGLAIFTGPVSAKQPLTDRLPAGSVAYVGWAGKSLTFDGSMFGQFLADRSISELIGAIKELAQNQLAPEEAEIFTPAWEIASLAWRHPIAVALTEFKTRPQREPVAQAVMLVDLGEDREKFEEQVAKVLAKVQGDREVVEKTVGSVTFKTVSINDENTISFGYIGNMFFFTVGPKGPEIIIGLQPDKTLAADKKFADAFKETGGENEQLSFYLDLAVAKDALEAYMEAAAEKIPPSMMIHEISETRPSTTEPATTRPMDDERDMEDDEGSEEYDEMDAEDGEIGEEGGPKLEKFAEALGLNNVTVLAGSVRIVDRQLYTKFKLFSPAPHRGVLMPFAGAPLTNEDLAGIPADADVAIAVRISPSELYKELRRVIREIDPNADDEFGEMISGAEGNLQMSIEDDLLTALGDTWVVSSATSQGGFVTGTVLSVTIKDKEKFTAALEKIETYMKENLPQGRRMQMSVETTKADRTEIHYLSIASKRMPIPVSPAWAVKGDKFYFAFWTQVLETTFAREGQSPLVATDAFAALRKRVSPGSSCIVYMNMSSILRQFYPSGLLLGSMGMTALQGATGNMSLPGFPPPLHMLEKYFGPEIYAISSDRTGIIFEGYGAQPNLVGLGVPVGVGIALPALSAARQNARRAASMANLNGIGKAIIMYQAEHETMPEHLGLLVAGGYCPANMFVSPLSGRKPPKFNEETKQLEGEIDYIFLDFSKVEDLTGLPTDAIMAYERPENYGNAGRTTVLCIDGSVRVMSLERLEEELEYTKKAIKAAEKEAQDF